MGSILAALSAVISSGYALRIGLVDTPVFAFCSGIAVLVAVDNVSATMNPRKTLHVLATPILIGAVVLTIPLILASLALPGWSIMVVMTGGILIFALLFAFVSLFVYPDVDDEESDRMMSGRETDAN